jgi:hypothetical protein
LDKRDVALVEITDKEYKPRKTILTSFVKDEDLTKVNEVKLAKVEPTRQSVYSGRTQMQQQLFGDASIHTSNGAEPAISVFWVGMKDVPTNDGDCGSCYLASTPSLSNRRIMAIHSAVVPASRTTKGAIVTQEDLTFLLESPSRNEVYQSTKDYDLFTIKHPISGEKWYADKEEYDRLTEHTDPLMDIEDTNRFQQIGHNPKIYRPIMNKPRYHEQCDYGLDIEDECVNAPSDARELTVKALAAQSTRGGRPSLLATQINKLAFKERHMDINLLEDVVDWVVQRYPFMANTRVLNDFELINGVTDHSDPFYGHIEPIHLSKSAGLASVWRGAREKRDCFEEYIDNAGNLRHKWASDGPGKVMQERFQRMKDLAKNGMNLVDPIEARLKSELLLRKDVEEKGKVRLYENVGLTTFLLHRKYLGGFGALAKKHRIKDVPFVIGYDPVTEMGDIFHELKSVSDWGENGDFSRFDKSVPYQVQEAAMEVLKRWFMMSPCQMKHSEIDNLFDVLLRQNTSEFHVAGGDIYVTHGSFNSGCYETNLGDGLFNVIMRNYIICKINEKRAHPLGKHPHEVMTAADKYMKYLVNGDDIITAIHPSMAEHFNFNSFKEEYKAIGMTYDLPAKQGAEKAELIRIEDMDFSSRHFSTVNGSIYGALKESSIKRRLFWTTDIGPEHKAALYESLLREAALHGKEFYDKYRARVTKAVAWHTEYSSPVKMSIPTHKAMMKSMTEDLSIPWIDQE